MLRNRTLNKPALRVPTIHLRRGGKMNRRKINIEEETVPSRASLYHGAYVH